MADAVGGAVGGVERGGPVEEALHFGTGGSKFGDADVEVGGVSVEERDDVPARWPFGVTDCDDLDDLGEGQPSGLGRFDEPEPGERPAVVVAIAGGGTAWFREDPGLLVEPEGFGADAGLLGQSTDPHAGSVRLDLPLRWNVYGPRHEQRRSLGSGRDRQRRRRDGRWDRGSEPR